MRVTACFKFFLFALILTLLAATPSFAQISITVSFAPPDLPVYDQPACPADGYIWTPGYWAWDGEEYYWVPGTWVLAPEAGYLWTPPYWAWNGNDFVFYEGYWAPEVGFYGGVDYGYGYFGHGYDGGRWDNGHFFYNRAANNVNATIVHNVYDAPISQNAVTRVSFNGGNGGIQARPTSQEEAIARGRHLPPVATQTEHVSAARANTQLRASVNHGKPSIAATPKPGVFEDKGVVPAKQAGALHNAPSGNTARNATPAPERNTGHNQPSAPENNAGNAHNAVHPNELPPMEHSAAPNTGNAQQDQKYQQQQEKLYAKQNQERQQLQQKQDQEHQQMTKRNGSDAQKQQMEQRHQQQTQQMVQKHTEQQQKLQAKQQPKEPAHTAQKQEK